jgi:transaldolase
MVQKSQLHIMSEVDCDKYFETLKQKGIKMQAIYDKLLVDGLDSFKVSFRDLLSKLIN